MSGLWLPKPLAFPMAKDLNWLFSAWMVWPANSLLTKPAIRPQVVHGRPKVGPYCAVRRLDGEHHALQVLCTGQTLAWIDQNMLDIENDTLYFELVEREDGVLVTVVYNLIIGSRWLALLPPGSVPCLGGG